MACCVVVAALSACNTLQSGSAASNSLEKFRQFTVADIQRADDLAVKHNDVVAHACWPVLKQFIENLPELSRDKPVVGGASGIETLRVMRLGVQGGLPDNLKIACAPLILDEQTFIARMVALAKF
jgi:hypothetical protein